MGIVEAEIKAMFGISCGFAVATVVEEVLRILSGDAEIESTGGLEKGLFQEKRQLWAETSHRG